VPEDSQEVDTHVERKGDGAYIPFSRRNSLKEAAGWMPVEVKVDYEDGHPIFGMPGRCTMNMLAIELIALVPS
jgi:hypothetical protein